MIIHRIDRTRTYDVFLGKGWTQWSRVKVFKVYETKARMAVVIAGAPLHDGILKDIASHV
jgi:hypothetical protein